MSEGAAPSGGGGSSAFQAAINSGGSGSGPSDGPPTSVRDAIARGEQSNPEANRSEAGPRPQRPKPQDPVEAKPQRQGRTEEPRQQREAGPSDDLDLERKVKAKINGQEREISLRQAIDFYQRGESANQRFQEAAEMKKAAEDARTRADKLLRDPKALVDALLDDGDGVKAVHEAYTELQRLAKLSPEQQQEYLRVKALEQRDAQLRQMEIVEQAKHAEARENALIDRHLDGLEDAYEAIGWAPSEKMQDITDMLAANIIEEMKESGVKASYKDVAGVIHEAVMDMVTDHVSSLDDAKLRELIGEKRLRKLMNAEVSQLQSRLPSSTPRDQSQPRAVTGKFEKQQPYIHQSGDLRGFRSLVEGR